MFHDDGEIVSYSIGVEQKWPFRVGIKTPNRPDEEGGVFATFFNEETVQLIILHLSKALDISRQLQEAAVAEEMAHLNLEDNEENTSSGAASP